MKRLVVVWAVLWLAGTPVAWGYAMTHNLPASVAVPATLALLMELSFYATLAFAEARQQLAWLGWRGLALILATAVIPYLVVAVPTGAAKPDGLLLLVAFPSVALFWFRWLPRARWTDYAFLCLMGGVYLTRLVTGLYPEYPGLKLSILGQLMWIRVGLFAALEIRRVEGTGFGFWPEWQHWKTGFAYFICLAPVVAALGYGLAFAHLRIQPGWWWKAPLTFFGILWVVALSEEFFFRGLLQQWLSQSFGSWPGLVASALAFGAVHLPFRSFPNWKFALLAAVAGLFYGLAYRHSRNIRSPMVTHALMVTTWRSFFV